MHPERSASVRAREVEIIVPSKRPLIVLDGEPMRVSRVGMGTLERGALPVLAIPLDQPGAVNDAIVAK